MKKAFQTSRKSRRATALSFPSSPTVIISRAKPPTTSSSFHPRRNCSYPCWKSFLCNCSPITSPSAAVVMSTSRAIWLNPSPWSSWPRFRYTRDMFPSFRAWLGVVLLFPAPALLPASSQTPEPTATSPLLETHFDVEKLLTEPQLISIPALIPVSQFARHYFQPPPS